MSQHQTIVSIAICTFNREKYFEKCLKSIIDQKSVATDEYEILIVDNNSTDRTKEISESYIKKYPNHKITYLFEEKTGLSNARNTAYQNAAGQYVAYIDDDGVAYEDWVDQIITFTRKYPAIQAFGGPSERITESFIPKWVPDSYGSVYLGDKEKEVTIGIIGCNMIFKKELLIKFGGFNPKLGMYGNKMNYGEEDELFKKMISHKMPIMYSPFIRIKHLLATYKLSMWWRLKSKFSKMKIEVMEPGTTDERIKILSNSVKLSPSLLLSNKPAQQKIYFILLWLVVKLAICNGRIQRK